MSRKQLDCCYILELCTLSILNKRCSDPEKSTSLLNVTVYFIWSLMSGLGRTRTTLTELGTHQIPRFSLLSSSLLSSSHCLCDSCYSIFPINLRDNNMDVDEKISYFEVAGIYE